MKIYRVVPNSFAIGERLNSENICSEEIYYSMGYTSFLPKTRHRFNNLGCEGKSGKYFFLFLEDAVAMGNNLVNNFHRLNSSICTILEYDVPIDVILKHIGRGNYTQGIVPLYLLETFIEKDDFGSPTIKSQSITEAEKERSFLEAFERFLKLVVDYDRYLYDEYDFYLRHFWIRDLSLLLENFDEYRSTLLNSPLFYALLQESPDLIPCQFITNRFFLLNQDLVSYTDSSFLNINLDNSQEQHRMKSAIIDSLDEDKEYVRELLKRNEGK